MKTSFRIALWLGVLLFAFSGPAGAVDKDDPFAASVQCPAEPVAAGGSAEIAVQYAVFSKDFFIYRDMSDVVVQDAAGLEVGPAEFPAGKVKFDKVSEQDREIFEENFRVRLPVSVPADAAAGERSVTVNAKWQGCNKPENFCLFPTNVDLSCAVAVVAASASSGDSSAAPVPDPPAAADGSAEPDPSAGGEAAGEESGSAEATEDSEQVAEAGAGEPDEGSAADPRTAAAQAAAIEGVSSRRLGSADPASENCAGTAGAKGAGATGLVAWVEGLIRSSGGESSGGSPGLIFLLLVFLGGIASSFTPCVYPMIPITISVIGASADQGRAKSMSLAVVYVIGIATTYTVLGLFAAQTGGIFGEALQQPWVLVGVAAVMFALALAMFGLYEFALPTSVTTRASMLGSGGSGGYIGAFVVGTVAGVVAAPCTGPIVAYLLLEIVQRGWGVFAGGVVMATYSLGLGMLFLVIGAFAGSIASLPRSGTWMVTVKKVFGVVLLGAGIFYADQSLTAFFADSAAEGTAPLVQLAWCVTILLAAWLLAGEAASLGPDRSLVRVGLGLALAVCGFWLVLVPEPSPTGPKAASDVFTAEALAELRGMGALDEGAELLGSIVDSGATGSIRSGEAEPVRGDVRVVVRAAADLAPSGADLEAATALQEAGVGLVLLSPSLTDSWVVVAPQRGIEWGDDHAAELAAATVSNKPTIVDFTADWCAACKELEHFTYTDPAVVRCSDEFETVMFDATRESPEFLDLKDHYGIQGLPAVFFVCPDGEVIDDLTLKGFEAADRFLEKMNIALNTCGRG